MRRTGIDFDRMTPRERYDYLMHSANFDGFAGDRPVNVPTASQVVGQNFDRLPAAYQMAVAG